MSSNSTLSVIEECKRVLQALRMHMPEVRVRGISTSDLDTIVQDLEQSEASVLINKTNLVNERSTRNERKSAAQKATRHMKSHIRNEFNASDPVYQTVFGKTTSSRSAKTSKAKLSKSTPVQPESTENMSKTD